MVVRMLKKDNKKNNELKEPKAMEGGTQESGGSGKAAVLRGVNNALHRSSTDTKVTKKLPAGGTVHRERSSALVTSKVKGQIVERQRTWVKRLGFPSITSKTYSREIKFSDFHLPTNNIPISGYTTFQQIDCYKVYFHSPQCISNAKTVAYQLKVQSTRVCEGSTSEGPFPFYEEVPLIKNLMASLMLKYSDDYIPTASTNTKLPLTVSP